MATDIAGLSRNEREIMQDFGEVGRLDDSFRVYKHRIKHKIHPTLTDTILILKYSDRMELGDYLRRECREDLFTLFDLLAEVLAVDITKNGNSKTPILTT